MSASIHPKYVVGFVDGEGSFHVAVYKDPRMRTGMKFIPEFHVSQDVSSKSVLDELVAFFGCGYVKEHHAKSQRDSTYVYVVRDRRDLLTRIIPFFERYELRTKKQHDFCVFADVVRRMQDNHHRDREKAKLLLDLAYSMNGAGRYRRRKHSIP